MREARLGEVVASMKNGLYKPASEYAEDGTPCLRMYNIEAGSIVWRDIKRMRLSEQELSDYALREGDLLVNRVNSRELVGKAAYISASLEPSVFESKNIRVRLDTSKVLPKFVNYQLLARGSRHFANNAQQVVGMASISQGQLADFPIVLADVGEQAVIVAELDKQFSRLDEAVANLHRVKVNVKRYKASVLRAAVEGRLVPTEAELARRESRRYESGQELLQRMLESRPSHQKGRGKREDAASARERQMDDVPEGWTLATVEQVAALVEYGSSAKTIEDAGGVPVLRMGNIAEGALEFEKLKYLPVGHKEFPRLLLRVGDLLFNRTNSPELVGKTAVFRIPNHPYSFASYLIRLRSVEGAEPEFLAAYINSSYGRKWVRRVVTQQVGQANVNGTKLRELVVPLPPHAEQLRIVAEVERRLSVVREVEAEVDANLKRASALRQAILAKAFSGAHA